MTNQKIQSQKRSAQEIQEWIITWLSKELEVEATEFNIEEEFVNWGLSSRQAVILTGELGDWLELELDPSLAWEYPTIKQLTEYLAQQTV